MTLSVNAYFFVGGPRRVSVPHYLTQPRPSRSAHANPAQAGRGILLLSHKFCAPHTCVCPCPNLEITHSHMAVGLSIRIPLSHQNMTSICVGNLLRYIYSRSSQCSTMSTGRQSNVHTHCVDRLHHSSQSLSRALVALAT